MKFGAGTLNHEVGQLAVGLMMGYQSDMMIISVLDWLTQDREASYTPERP